MVKHLNDSEDERQEVDANNSSDGSATDEDETTIDARTISGGSSRNEECELKQEAYDISSYPYLAKPIIFDHERFSTKHSTGLRPAARKGTNKDVEALEKVFEDLGCWQPEIHQNEKTKGIKETLARVAQEDHSKYACLIVVVLTHGDENELYSYDGSYETRDLWEPFTTGSIKNQTLAGKPKLFFVQACRGDDLDPGEDLTVTDARPVPAAKPALKRVPRCADVLIAHASFLGYKSMRNTAEGSWFIQTLCRAIAKFKSEDLLSILTIVQHGIAYNKTYMSATKKIPFVDARKQMPCVESTLTKKLFLGRKPEDKGGEPMDHTDSVIGRKTEENYPSKEEKLAVPLLFGATSSFFNADHFAVLTAVVCLVILFMAWLMKAEVQCHCFCNGNT